MNFALYLAMSSYLTETFAANTWPIPIPVVNLRMGMRRVLYGIQTHNVNVIESRHPGMVMVVVVMMVMVVGMWGMLMRMFAVQNRLTRINLGDLTLPAAAIGAVAETGERAVIHGVDVLGVGYAGHGIIVPIEVAGFDGRFEPGEHFQVHL